ncbi:putative DNA-binding domain-containing protein [Geothrix sp. 21YS21S-2]|uniref:HvfC/BufC family peptide modification chaperone n=1 Tax=Geothrix sp. 21YS21S-2 TaxID=3068893 RepID=UPI0027B89963|nr:putative DNA-binding domain-containing protein [Geothrix sp. 21YS21S-2]
MPDAVLALQRSLAALALDPDAAAFEADPGAFAAARGLPEGDQAAFRRYRDRLLYYRDAVREDICEPVDQDFPLTRTLLEGAGAWGACRAGFLSSRTFRSPFYRDISATFLGWLATSAWGRDRWPFLLELAHFELVRQLVEHLPDAAPPAGLRAVPRPGDLLVLAPSTQVLAYAYRVHEATWEAPAPEPGACRLLASRDAQGFIQWRELTEAAACLLARARGASLAAVAEELGLADLPGLLSFLAGLREAGAVLGFREA